MNEPMSARMTALAARGRAVTYGAKRAVVSRLLRAWDAAPALRLGQLLLAACERAAPPLPLFAVEDERLADMVEAMAVVPEKTPLTPTERLLAPILAAWDAWRPEGDDLEDDAEAVLCELTDVFDRYGYLGVAENEGDLLPLSAKAEDLLARARKAGVL